MNHHDPEPPSKLDRLSNPLPPEPFAQTLVSVSQVAMVSCGCRRRWLRGSSLEECKDLQAPVPCQRRPRASGRPCEPGGASRERLTRRTRPRRRRASERPLGVCRGDTSSGAPLWPTGRRALRRSGHRRPGGLEPDPGCGRCGGRRPAAAGGGSRRGDRPSGSGGAGFCPAAPTEANGCGSTEPCAGGGRPPPPAGALALTAELSRYDAHDNVAGHSTAARGLLGRRRDAIGPDW